MRSSASSRPITCAAAAMAASGLRTSWAKLRAARESASCRARSSASRCARSAADSSRNTATTPPSPSWAVLKPSVRSVDGSRDDSRPRASVTRRAAAGGTGSIIASAPGATSASGRPSAPCASGSPSAAAPAALSRRRRPTASHTRSPLEMCSITSSRKRSRSRTSSASRTSRRNVRSFASTMATLNGLTM